MKLQMCKMKPALETKKMGKTNRETETGMFEGHAPTEKSV